MYIVYVYIYIIIYNPLDLAIPKTFRCFLRPPSCLLKDTEPGGAEVNFCPVPQGVARCAAHRGEMDMDWCKMAVCQNLVPLVNIKIAGKWMFIPQKMVLIGIDPYPNHRKLKISWSFSILRCVSILKCCLERSTFGCCKESWIHRHKVFKRVHSLLTLINPDS